MEVAEPNPDRHLKRHSQNMIFLKFKLLDYLIQNRQETWKTVTAKDFFLIPFFLTDWNLKKQSPPKKVPSEIQIFPPGLAIRSMVGNR